MFRGITAVNLDAKGRLAVPKRFRDQFENSQLIVTIDTEAPCLLMYPLAQWETIEAKIQALPSFNPQARRIQRLLIGHAQDLEIDANSRILIPGLLRDYAKMDKRMVMVGQGKKIELWDELTWNSHREVWLAETDQATEYPEELQSISL